MACSLGGRYRVLILVALLIVAAIALRGVPPGGVRHPSAERAPSEPAALVLVVALLAVSLAIVAAALIARMRDPRASAPIGGRLDWSRNDAARPRWRVVLIVAGVSLVVLGAVVLLARFGPSGPAELPVGSAPEAAPGTAPPADSAPAPPAEAPASGNVLRFVYATAAGFLVLVAASSIVATRRDRRPLPGPGLADGAEKAPASTDAGGSLVRAAERALATVGDLSREPRVAIIACYAAMERELATVPGAAPRDFGTASEVLARAVEYGALRSDSATQLVRLFEEARFSPHVMDEGHRDSAVAALQLVLGELRAAK